MTASPLSLGPLRLRLTAWYVATFGLILALLGVGLFLSVRSQLSRELDHSLRAATAELIRAARIREMEAASARGQVIDAVDELHIPERRLFLLDIAGQPIKPATVGGWIQTAALQAARAGSADAEHENKSDETLRLHAERFALAGGTPLVAVAVADSGDLEERYAALIAAFSGAALVALVLVAIGGWVLVQQSTRPVEQSMEQMRRFMADAAHELRTPLTVLRSRVEVALQQPRAAGAYVEALEGIGAESRRLGKIVEDLLMLARADAGERRVERQRVYLDDLALDAAGAARVMGQANDVDVDVVDFEEAAVDGDPALLRQLLMIVLDNAVKFTPAGGAVRVSVRHLGGRPVVTIADTGVGIPDDQLPQIFERFYRGDPARTRGLSAVAHTTGAGLGLSIARWIAEVHGASIGVESAAGRGTTVTITFPPAVAPLSGRSATPALAS